MRIVFSMMEFSIMVDENKKVKLFFNYIKKKTRTIPKTKNTHNTPTSPTHKCRHIYNKMKFIEKHPNHDIIKLFKEI